MVLMVLMSYRSSKEIKVFQGAQGSTFTRSESNSTATAGQTTFTEVSGGYTNGDDVDVFVNGVV